jgi:hypothetical protein
MKRITSSLMCVALLVAWGCSNPKNLRVTSKNRDAFLDEIKNSKGLTVEEVQLLTAYMMRYGLAEGLKGLNQGRNDLPLEGKTVGELIGLQKKWMDDQKTAEAREKKLAQEAKAKEEAIKAELQKSLTLTVYDKGFVPSNYEVGRYSDYITYSIVYQNTSLKDIRAFQGKVVFQDLFGDKVMDLNLKITDPVKAGEQARWQGTSEYNQFRSQEVRLRNAELKDLKVVWVPTQIIFADGTTIPQDQEKE